MGVNIIGTGSYVPDNILDNEMLSKLVDTNDEWIVERTGIRRRHISKDETTEDMALKACQRAIEKSSIDVDEIEMIIVASVTSDTKVPSTAFTIAGRMGLKNIICMDINVACSGYIYAIATAKAMMRDMGKKYALVVGAERLTKYVNWEDRTTCILFGDGAGCMILENEDLVEDRPVSKYKYEIIDYHLGGKPDVKKYLTIDAKDKIDDEDNLYIGMNGRQVYKFATDVGPKVIDKLLKDNSVDESQVYSFVAHQANMRIIECLSDRSNIGMDRWYTNIQEYGNTSSASVAIAFDEVVSRLESSDQDEGDILGKYLITTAFGGGLSFGGILIKIKKV